MSAHPGRPDPVVPATGPVSSLEDRLEGGEIVFYPLCPFPLPEEDDRLFLLDQQRSSTVHKNISYDPSTGKVTGFRRHSAVQADRLRHLLAAFSDAASGWLAATLPRYARTWRLDRASFRPEEEATRQLRWTARNDLLHVDAFPNRPTQGDRILRLFVNVNRTEPRIWVTSEPFAKLLARFGADVGLPTKWGLGWTWRLRQEALHLFQPGQPRRSIYDAFMLRFHDFLKANDDFQERSPKRYWTFPPGSAWLGFTDGISHAALRGRYALEHSFFVSLEALVLPAEAPAVLLERACGVPVQRGVA